MPRPRSKGEWELRPRGKRPHWYAYRRIEGRDEWRSLGLPCGRADEGTARQALADFVSAFTAAESAAARVTVAGILDNYVANRLGRVTAHSRLVEASRPLKAELGHLRPDQMTEAAWEKYCDDRGVSDGTLRRERNVLVAAFNLARLPISITPPPPPPPRLRYLTREEAARLLGEFVSPHARLLYTICLYTGCRKGQALALTWDRVDFENNRIDFNEPGRAETVKRRAVVPMGPKLRAAMFEASEMRTSKFVIEWDGKRATKVRWPWRQARRRAGLGDEVTPHVLRHTAASWLAMGGVPLDQAADLLACDPVTLRRVYRKFDPSYLAGAVATLEGE